MFSQFYDENWKGDRPRIDKSERYELSCFEAID